MTDRKPTFANDELAKFVEDIGLSGEVTTEDIRDLGDGTYVMVRPVNQDWLLQYGALNDFVGYFDRWLYNSRESALEALNKVPCPVPMGYEPDGWTLHPLTGRKGPGRQKSAPVRV